MKRAIALLAITGGLLVGTAGTASANHPPQPVGGCPTGDGFFLFPAADLFSIDNGSSMDQNGDGFVCARVNKGQSTKFNGGDEDFGSAFTTKDNTNPLR